MNMVIHDLRNPASAVHFGILETLNLVKTYNK